MKPNAIITAVLLSAVASSCADSIEAPVHSLVGFTIDASTCDTRTQWGESGANGYDMEWCADDRIAVILSSADNFAEASVGHLSADRLSASFEVDMALNSTPAEYRFYACCPASAFASIVTAADDPEQTQHIDFTIPSHQRPTQRSFDPTAAVIFGSSASEETMPSSVAMRFTSITAYGKITVKDLPLSDGEHVESITLATSQPLSGAATYYFDESQPQTIAAESASSAIEIEYAADSGTFSTWFAAIPASLRDGKLCVCVKTDRGRYEKMIDLSGKEFVLEQNRILSFTVDMSLTRCSQYPVWHRIASPDMIADRPHIIVCNGFYCSNSELSFDNHPQAVPLDETALSVDGDCLYGEVDDAMKWDFTVSTTGEIIISRCGAPDTWLYAANTNNGIYVDDNAARRYKWRFGDEGGSLRAACTNNRDKRYLGITSSGWRSYTSYTNANYISSAIELYGLYVE